MRPGWQCSVACATLIAWFVACCQVIRGAEPEPPIRVADVIGGHIHPSLCRTTQGDLLAVYNISGGGGKELLLCRSTNGGKTWSKPAAIEGIHDCSIYPGSLTTLRDGRIALHWSCYRVEGERRWRVPQFSISEDFGHTWSKPRELPLEDLTNYTCLRHPVLELADGRWVCPLYDRTVVYDPAAHRTEPFGDGRNHGMVPIIATALAGGVVRKRLPPPSIGTRPSSNCHEPEAHPYCRRQRLSGPNPFAILHRPRLAGCDPDSHAEIKLPERPGNSLGW